MRVREDQTSGGQLAPLFDSALKGSQLSASEGIRTFSSQSRKQFLRGPFGCSLEPNDDAGPNGLKWIATSAPVA
jgi:hypothetical protein